MRAAIVCFLVAAVGVRAADPSIDFFDKAPGPVLKIEIDEANLAKLKKAPREYVHATLREGDSTVYKDIGLHLKGAAGSFRNWEDKPALSINMDKFSVAQAFHGIDKFHLNNSVQDGSYMNEAICGELMRAAGVPAARTTHAVLTLPDHRPRLYVLKEGFDTHFLRHHFKNTTGNLYDSGFLQDIEAKLKKSGGMADVTDQGDLKALVAACREPDRAKRFAKIDKLLEVDRFISMAVMEAITVHWDGYCQKANNYRVYHDPDTGKLTFIAHGMDQMFQDPNAGIGFSGGAIVARSLFETPEAQAKYKARLSELMEKVVVWPQIEKRIDFHHKRARDAIAPIRQDVAAGLDGSVRGLKNAIKTRIDIINKQLAKASETKP
ncbi:MAG: CotH kinase family protein [Gemmataceae bacterium]